MERVKCECGHVNPPGTILCEACGKILDPNEEKKRIIDMRYEGAARRSQTYNRTIIDKIWNFFSSVKVGVVLIVLALIASAIGTILPQEMNTTMNVPPKQYYEENYGVFGRIYYLLGFHDLYGSTWYILLIAAIGVSLTICSIDRALPLYKALKRQRITRHNSFMKRQRLFNEGTVENWDDQINTVSERMRQKKYRVLTESGNLFAEKGRFSRWGPYINHIGLIIVLIGAMFRFAPGMYVNEMLWIKEGETKAIPGTDQRYYLTNHEFIVEVYDESDREVYREALEKRGNIIKNFQTNVTLYEAEGEVLPGEDPQLKEIKKGEIRVNHPLRFEHFGLYQASYLLNELSAMTFQLVKKETEEVIGELTIDLENPEKRYDLGKGYIVEILAYFPDVEFKDGELRTKSPNPNNPAFAFQIRSPEHPEGERSVVFIQETLEPLGENDYKLVFKEVDTVNYSGLMVRKDRTLGLIAFGGAIFLFGVILGSFWQHRRIWIKRDGGKLLVSAHTNKNWYGFMKEIETILADTDVPIPIDRGGGLDKPERANKGGDVSGSTK